MTQKKRLLTELLISASKRIVVGFSFIAVITVAIGIVLPFVACVPAYGQMQTVSVINTFAGNGTAGFSGDGAQATAASLNFPRGPAFDSAGNLYISDYDNNRVRKIAPDGIITTIAGNGTRGSTGDGGPATSAELNSPAGIAVDQVGNVYVAEYGGNRIREINLPTGNISTIAGTGVGGYSGDGGAATAALLNSPQNPTFDSAGNLYFADHANNRVRKITMTTGVITTVAGTGAATTTGNGGPATNATLHGPVGVVFDTTDNLYISERDGYVLRKVAVATGIISTFAGTGVAGFSGDGGPATSAEFNLPYGIAFDAAGNVFISDVNNERVRVVNITTGIITSIAGNGTTGFSGDGGQATSAEFDQPIELVTDKAGHLYVADAVNNRIREFALSNLNFPNTNVGSSSATRIIQLETTATETITSITVPQSQGGKQEYSIGTITGCTIGASNPVDTVCSIPITFTPAYPGQRWIPLQVVTSTGNINFGLTGIGIGPLAALTPGIISTVAGNGTAGYSGDSGAATSAELNSPFDTAIDYAGNLYIADYGNHVVRKVAAGTGAITTVVGNGTNAYSGDGGPATSAAMQNPISIAIDSAGDWYIADHSALVVRKVNAATGIITTVAGTGTVGYSGDGGQATAATLSSVTNIALDSAGNLYISDGGNGRVRMVSAATGIISTVAGNGTGGSSGDGGQATNAAINFPYGLAFDSTGNLYIAENQGNRIRKVTISTGVITTIAGNGTGGFSGDGGQAVSAEVFNPCGLRVDNAGNVYIADTTNYRIREVSATTGIITTIAGTGGTTASGDGGSATKAGLAYPSGIVFDGPGNIYITDYVGGNAIRKVDVSQSQLTYPTATTVGTSDATDNPQTAVVSNVGNASLTVPPPSSGNNPTITADFQIASSSTCPQLTASSSSLSLAAGADCTYAINFVPTTTGAIAGSAVLTENSLNIVGSTQTINLSGTGLAVTTTTTVTSSLNPSAYTQSVTFTATVVPTTGTAVPTGAVQFSVGGVATGSPVTLSSSGTATYTTSTLTVGSHNITATYTSNSADYSSSISAALSQVVNKLTLGQGGLANITLSSFPNPSTYTQSVIFTATVPTGVAGTVNFVDGTTVLGTGTISGTTATFTTTTLAVGTHPVTAVYSGNVDYNPATSAIDNQVVNKATLGQNGIANITLISSPNPSTYTQSVIFTATVPTGVTGTVNFVDGTTVLGTGRITGTIATFTTTTLTVGTHPVTAVYSGDTNYNTATSAVDNQVVNKGTAPTITWPTPAAITYGTALSGTQLDATSTVAGKFTYSPASAVVLNAGTQTLNTIFTPTDTTDYQTATATVQLVVNKQATTLLLTPSATTVVAGAPVTLTVTVTPAISGTPTGTVTIFDNGTAIGTVTLSGATGSLTTTTLSTGANVLNAIYSDDTNYAASTTSGATGATTITVTPASTPDFIVGSTTSSLSADPGATAVFTITVAPTTGNTFTNPVTLSVTGLPANSTSGFAPLTVTPGSGTATSQMSVQTFTQVVAALEHRQRMEAYKYAAFSCMLLPLLGIRRLRKRLSKVGIFFVLGIATFGATTALTGCGGGYFGPAPISYTLTVTGTSGSLQHSTTVTLNVR